MLGMGGIWAEVSKDVTFRIHLLTNDDAHDMLRSVRAYQILEGWRGGKLPDTKTIEQLLLRISAMVEDLPATAELDLNPVKAQVAGRGYVVIDA